MFAKADFIFFSLLLFGLGCAIMVLLSANPILSLIYFNIFVILSSCVLAFLDLIFFSIVFIIVYIGAITIFFIFLIMMADVRLIKNFSISYDHLFSIVLLFFVIFIIYVSIFHGGTATEYGYLQVTELPINIEALETTKATDQLAAIGFLFMTDFLILVIICFLLLICIIIFIIGFRETTKEY